jgi:hypothetical protein
MYPICFQTHPSSNINPYLTLFFHLKQFSWLRVHQVEVYNTSMNSKSKRTMKKKHEKNKLSKSQNVWKNPLDLPSYFQTPYLPFYLCWGSKKLWVHQLKLYKNSLNPKGKKTMSKDFALQIIKCFNTPITKHQPTLFWNLIFFSFLIFFSDIRGYKCVKWVITRSLNFKNNEGMPKDFKLVDILNV